MDQTGRTTGCNGCATQGARLWRDLSTRWYLTCTCVQRSGRSRVVISSIRTAILFLALSVAACLPPLAADWLFPVPVAGVLTRAANTNLGENSTSSSLQAPLAPLPSASVEEAPGHQLYDVHGNEIVLPVVRYGIDHRGSLYELHSPYTELPRLDPPEL
jgi:hypothetical protein